MTGLRMSYARRSGVALQHVPTMFNSDRDFNQHPLHDTYSPMATFTPRQTSRELGGRETQVFMQSFADRILVLVTQMGKVGNLVRLKHERVLPPYSLLRMFLLNE